MYHCLGAAGIHAIYGANRIDGNEVYGITTGIQIDWDGSTITRNSVGGGIQYEIAANNYVGIIEALSPSGAISGSSGGVGVGQGIVSAWPD